MQRVNGATGSSCWVATAPERDGFPALARTHAKYDVAVIGGGIVGVTAALLLKRAGLNVVVLEAARIGSQVTGGSTAKVTSQHGVIYGHIAEHIGADAADAYARSNEVALAWISAQVRERAIDCDFEMCDAYTYSAANVRAVEQEVEAAERLGLPVRLERDLALPVAVEAAVRFERQAQFHPMKYVVALARELAERGGQVHEASRVLDVDSGTPCTLVTEHGKVRADEVIVATNIPFLDRGGFFGRAFPYRHMCIAAPVDNDRVPQGMFISADSPTRSFRSTRWSDTQRLMLFIGEAFPTGQADAGEKLRALEHFAREHFDVAEPLYRWGNQDYYAADRIPYVGPILPGASHLRVATGFNAWGITTGTAAAHILADDILGRENEWAWLYDSKRLGLRAGGRELIGKNIGVAKSWLGERLHRAPEREPASIERGEAALTRMNGTTAAAYRDEEGVLHAFDARCTHMGCHVRWNGTERSWDCHCHGSRFDVDGRVLQGPAVKPLQSVSPSG